MIKETIHVVDDDDSMRASLLRLLRAQGFAAEGYPSAGDFLLLPSIDHHGCMLVDLRMPGPSGLDLQAALQKKGIHLPIVFMTGHGDVASCAKALRGGAVDFLEKPIDPAVLIEVVERALSRDREARSLRDEHRRLQAAFQSLSGRERQIFELVVSGKLNKQIAQALNVAERTVKAQRSSLMAKLDIHSAAGLGQFAERLRSARSAAGA
jgi:RNA polymerase sigma factor (sigma-70 family)